MFDQGGKRMLDWIGCVGVELGLDVELRRVIRKCSNVGAKGVLVVRMCLHLGREVHLSVCVLHLSVCVHS